MILKASHEEGLSGETNLGGEAIPAFFAPALDDIAPVPGRHAFAKPGRFAAFPIGFVIESVFHLALPLKKCENYNTPPSVFKRIREK